jgi:hypothetical protein
MAESSNTPGGILAARRRPQADPLDHVLGPSRRRKDLVWIVVSLGAWAGFLWWIGRSDQLIGEVFAVTTYAAYRAIRMSVAKREWPRLKAFGAKTRLRCTCDTCERLRTEELAARRPDNAVEA